MRLPDFRPLGLAAASAAIVRALTSRFHHFSENVDGKLASEQRPRIRHHQPRDEVDNAKPVQSLGRDPPDRRSPVSGYCLQAR